jgi:hypothetical protein
VGKGASFVPSLLMCGAARVPSTPTVGVHEMGKTRCVLCVAVRRFGDGVLGAVIKTRSRSVCMLWLPHFRTYHSDET